MCGVGILEDSHGLLAVPAPGPASQAHSLTLQATGNLPHGWVSAAPSSLAISFAGRTPVASIPFSRGWRHEGSTSCLSPLTLSRQGGPGVRGGDVRFPPASRLGHWNVLVPGSSRDVETGGDGLLENEK